MLNEIYIPHGIACSICGIEDIRMFVLVQLYKMTGTDELATDKVDDEPNLFACSGTGTEIEKIA